MRIIAMDSYGCIEAVECIRCYASPSFREAFTGYEVAVITAEKEDGLYFIASGTLMDDGKYRPLSLNEANSIVEGIATNNFVKLNSLGDYILYEDPDI